MCKPVNLQGESFVYSFNHRIVRPSSRNALTSTTVTILLLAWKQSSLAACILVKKVHLHLIGAGWHILWWTRLCRRVTSLYNKRVKGHHMCYVYRLRALFSFIFGWFVKRLRISASSMGLYLVHTTNASLFNWLQQILICQRSMISESLVSVYNVHNGRLSVFPTRKRTSI
jgi:hypothetical protein